MSLLAPIEALIHRLDGEAAAELAAVKRDFEIKLANVLPVIEKLRNDLQAVVTTAAETAVPGIEAGVAAAVNAAERDLRSLLGL